MRGKTAGKFWWVEKGGKRGHDVSSYIRSLEASVTGKFLTAMEMLHSPREYREGMKEEGQSLPGLPVPSCGCLTVLHNRIPARLFNRK